MPGSILGHGGFHPQREEVASLRKIPEKRLNKKPGGFFEKAVAALGNQHHGSAAKKARILIFHPT
jgi:hypothetical protein